MTHLYLNKLLPLSVFVCGLVATWFLQQAAFDAAHKIQRDNFDYQVREIVLRIEQRLKAYEQVLHGAKGLFVASKSVERNEFRDYVASLRLADIYPGIQGVGFSLVIPPQKKDRHIRDIRKEGFPSYTLRPEGERDLYTSIIFLEPFADRNLRAFGYDMYSEPVRRAAMEEARDQNKSVLSGKVKLVQETEKNVQAGVLMYAPVFRNGMPHETPEERRANIFGWAYSPFRMNDLMQGILGNQANRIDIEVYDEKNADTEALMYDSDYDNNNHNNKAALFHTARHIKVIGHDWMLKLHSLPSFEADIATGQVTAIRLTGFLISVLLSLLVWQLIGGRARALELAREMTGELREKQERIQLLLDSAAEGVYGLDTHGHCTFVNAAFLRILGYQDAGEVVGKDIHELIHHSRADGTPYPMEACLAHQAFRHSEGVHVDDEVFWRHDGSSLAVEYWSFPIIRDGRIEGAVATFFDISERKQAQETLRLKTEEVDTFFNTALDLLCIANTEGYFLRLNPAWENTLGYTLDDLQGKRFLDFVHPDDMDDTLQVISELSEQKAVLNFTNRYCRKDGSYRWIEWHSKPVGKIIYAAARDITERKEFEEELKRSNAELEQFGYAVSHDMRQPLRMISSYLQLLERSLAGQLDGEKRDYFNYAVEGAKRIDQMLVALLEYSRVGRKGEPPTWAESRALLDEALQFLQPAIAEAQARVSIEGDWPRVLTCHDEILRLLQNLIGNAIKFRIAGRAPEITVTSEVIMNEWRMCVADNGVGIIPEQIKRLFKVFQRLQSREAYEGTGVGLALCRKIAEHYKGRIWAESAGEGKGSQFHVVLPVLRGKA